MSRKDLDYHLPVVGDRLRTENQIKPHRGFKPEAITARQPRPFVNGDGVEPPFTAKPPAWTEQARCVPDETLTPGQLEKHWELWDEPSVGQFWRVLKPICDACPVKALCRDAAMSMEGDLPAQFRSGVWGGLMPKHRASLANGVEVNVDECVNGHKRTSENVELHGRQVRGCRDCRRERKAA